MDRLEKIKAAHACVRGGEKTYLYLINQLESLFPNLKQFFSYTETKSTSGFVVKTFTTQIKGTRDGEIITFSISRGETGPVISYSCSLHGTRTISASKKDYPRLFREGTSFLDSLILCELEKITPTP